MMCVALLCAECQHEGLETLVRLGRGICAASERLVLFHRVYVLWAMIVKAIFPSPARMFVLSDLFYFVSVSFFCFCSSFLSSTISDVRIPYTATPNTVAPKGKRGDYNQLACI